MHWVKAAFNVYWYRTPACTWSIILGFGLFLDVLANVHFRKLVRPKLNNIANGMGICLIYALFLPILSLCRKFVVVHGGSGLISMPPAGIGIAGTMGAVVAYFLAADFLYYWWHRLQHHWLPLWRFHALHHSDPEVSASTYARQHWTESLFQGIFLQLPMLLIFGNPEIVAGYSVLFTTWTFFVHSDVRLGAGRWSWLVTTPAQHRVHHGVASAFHNSNFAGYFPVWDMLFGTYREGEKGRVETGLDGADRALRGIQMDLLWVRGEPGSNS